MPTCQICQSFYIRPQTFETLFSRTRICMICETYATLQLSKEVIPIDQNVIEYSTFNQTEHPVFTQKIFRHLINDPEHPYVFYEQAWLKEPVVFHLIAKLCMPFKLFSYEQTLHELEIIFSITL